MSDHVEILLVEDNEADIVLVQEALRDAKVYNSLHVVRDGDQAIKFLTGDKTVNPKAIRPGLVLLDLYLPNIGGQEVLKYVKTDKNLKTIPVVVMTSSLEEADVARAYEQQANSYIVKPVNFNQLINVVSSIEDFWLSVVRLPKK